MMKRRTLWALGLAAPAAVAAALALRPTPTDARPAAPAPRRAPAAGEGGGAVLQRRGPLPAGGRGRRRRPGRPVLPGRRHQRPDQEPDRCKTSTAAWCRAVSYDSHDPVERTLKSFAVDLTGNPGQAQLLDQARGEKVEVVLQPDGRTSRPARSPARSSGSSTRSRWSSDKAVTDVAFLNLWCADGLRSVKLADVQRVRFLNPVLESEYRRALDTLALSHDAQKKAVSLAVQRHRAAARCGSAT